MNRNWLLLGCAVVIAIPVAVALYGQRNSASSTEALTSETPKDEIPKGETPKQDASQTVPQATKLESATFGGGCFWCTEAVFQQLKGVASVKSGYSGGTTKKPTYEEVCSETTDHAEVVQIEYDPAAVEFKDLLKVFFHTHDPTTLNRQGADVGRRYRSVIFYHNDEQKRLAEKAIAALDDAKVYSTPIVTEITQYKAFYPAENYHQNYFAENSSQPYCRYVIRPKLEKLHAVFRDKVK